MRLQLYFLLHGLRAQRRGSQPLTSARRRPRPCWHAAWALGLIGLLPLPAGAAAAPEEPEQVVTVQVGQAHLLEAPEVRRIAVGNGKVIQATALDERQVLVLPEAPGQSSLVLWNKAGRTQRYAFTVLAADTARALSEVKAMVGSDPGTRVSVRAVGDKILVEGSEVSEELSSRIAEVARRYPQVVNLLPKVGLERMIAMDVKFVEIRRDLLEDLGIRWNGAMNGPSFQVIGDMHRSGALQPGGSADGSGLELRPRVAPFASNLSLASSLSSMLNFLVQRGDAAILAEPRLSCRSGGSARFIAGGELPIPMTGALGTTSVTFKEYGIRFDVQPTASDSGVIAAKLATEISAINFDVAIKDVPGLSKRRAETDVNLREHQTLVIAGLLTEESTRGVDRIAGLSELPVLGALFRSKRFRDRQTELVVFVTPRFVVGSPANAAAAAPTMQAMRPATRLLPPAVPPDPLSDPTVREMGPALDFARSTPAPSEPATPAVEAEVTVQDARAEDRGTLRRYEALRRRPMLD